jgi:hypothetical protein
MSPSERKVSFFIAFLCILNKKVFLYTAKAQQAMIPTERGSLCYNIIADGSRVDTAAYRKR